VVGFTPRDVFGAPRRTATLEALASCEQALEEYADSGTSAPLSTSVNRTFEDDNVRGIVLTDALIGTQGLGPRSDAHSEPAPPVPGDGQRPGEWHVPIGGMGAVTGSPERSALHAGAMIRTGATVTLVESDGVRASVLYRTDDGTEHRIDAKCVAAARRPVASQPRALWLCLSRIS